MPPSRVNLVHVVRLRLSLGGPICAPIKISECDGCLLIRLFIEHYSAAATTARGTSSTAVISTAVYCWRKYIDRWHVNKNTPAQPTPSLSDAFFDVASSFSVSMPWFPWVFCPIGNDCYAILGVVFSAHALVQCVKFRLVFAQQHVVPPPGVGCEY